MNQRVCNLHYHVRVVNELIEEFFKQKVKCFLLEFLKLSKTPKILSIHIYKKTEMYI